MKGVVLCGGTGSRLYPLTNIVNKHLLPIYNEPMVHFPLKTLINSGIEDIMIVAGKGHCGQFLELLGDGSDFGANLSYMVQEKPGGIAQALGLCKRFIGDSEHIAVILGDNIFQDSFNFDDFCEKDEQARIYLKKVLDPQRFGVVKINNGRLTEIVEKPKNWHGAFGFAVTGLYLYDYNVFDIIKELKPSDRKELEITDVNNEYIKRVQLSLDYRIVKGFWSDAGTFESLYKASIFIRENKGEKKENNNTIIGGK